MPIGASRQAVHSIYHSIHIYDRLRLMNPVLIIIHIHSVFKYHILIPYSLSYYIFKDIFNLCTYFIYSFMYSFHILIHVLVSYTHSCTRFIYSFMYSFHILIHVLISYTHSHTHFIYSFMYSFHILIHVLNSYTYSCTHDHIYTHCISYTCTFYLYFIRLSYLL